MNPLLNQPQECQIPITCGGGDCFARPVQVPVLRISGRLYPPPPLLCFRRGCRHFFCIRDVQPGPDGQGYDFSKCISGSPLSDAPLPPDARPRSPAPIGDGSVDAPSLDPATNDAMLSRITITSEYVSHPRLIQYELFCRVCYRDHRVTYYQDDISSALFPLKSLRMRCYNGGCDSDPRISDVGQRHSVLSGAMWLGVVGWTMPPDIGMGIRTALLRNAPTRVRVRFRCPMCSSRVISHIWNRSSEANFYTPEEKWSCDCGESVPTAWWFRWRLLRLPVGLIQNAEAATLFLGQCLPHPLDVSEILPLDCGGVSSGEASGRSVSASEDLQRSDRDGTSAGAAAVGGAAGESQSRSADDGGASASAQLDNLVGGCGGQVGAGDPARNVADPSGGVSMDASSVSVLSDPAATRSAASEVSVAQAAAILRLSLMCRRCRCEFYVDLQRAEGSGGGDDSVTYNYNAEDQWLSCPSSRRCNEQDDLPPFPPIPASSVKTKGLIRKSLRSSSCGALVHSMFEVVDSLLIASDQGGGGPVPISRSGLRTLSHKVVAGSLLFDVTPVDAGRGCCAIVAFHTESSIHVHDVGPEGSAVAVEKALVTTADRECRRRTAEVSLFASGDADGRRGGLAVLTEKLREGGALTQQQYDGERTRVRLGLRAVVEQTPKPSRASVLREGASMAREGASVAREGAAALVARGGVESTLYDVGGSGDGDSETMPYGACGDDWRPIPCGGSLEVFLRRPSNKEVEKWWSGEGSVGPSLVHAIFPKTEECAEVTARSRALYVNLGGYNLGQLKNDLLPRLEECDVVVLATDSLRLADNGSIDVVDWIETVRVFVVEGRAADDKKGAQLHLAFIKAVRNRRPVEEGERPLILFTHCQAKKEDVEDVLKGTKLCVVSGSGGAGESTSGGCGHVDVTDEGAVYCPPLWLDAKLPASKWCGWAINYPVKPAPPQPTARPSSLVRKSFWGPPPHLDLILQCCKCECEFPMRFRLTPESPDAYTAPDCVFRCPYLCTAPNGFHPIPVADASPGGVIDDKDWKGLGYKYVRHLKFHETVEGLWPTGGSVAFAHAIRRVRAKIRAPCCGEEREMSFQDLGGGKGMGYLLKKWPTDGGVKDFTVPTEGYGEVPGESLQKLRRKHICTKASLLPVVEYINEAACKPGAPQVPPTGASGAMTILPVDAGKGASVAIRFDETKEVHVVDVGYKNAGDALNAAIDRLMESVADPAPSPSIRVFITHNDEDHDGGLGQFMDRRPAELKSIVRNPFSPGEQWASGFALLDVSPPKDGLPLLRDPQRRQESGFKYQKGKPYWLRVQVFGTVEVAVLVHDRDTVKNSYQSAREAKGKDLKNPSSLVYGVFDVSEVPFMERTYARFLNLGDLDMEVFWGNDVLPKLKYCEVFCAPHHGSHRSIQRFRVPRASVYLVQGYPKGPDRVSDMISHRLFARKVKQHLVGFVKGPHFTWEQDPSSDDEPKITAETLKVERYKYNHDKLAGPGVLKKGSWAAVFFCGRPCTEFVKNPWIIYTNLGERASEVQLKRDLETPGDPDRIQLKCCNSAVGSRVEECGVIKISESGSTTYTPR